MFKWSGTTISWRVVKQLMLITTSSNHSKILTIHEVSHSCVWLGLIIQYIRELCGLFSIKDNSNKLFEDNVACIAWLKRGFIEGDKTKHISFKFFYTTRKLQENSEIDI